MGIEKRHARAKRPGEKSVRGSAHGHGAYAQQRRVSQIFLRGKWSEKNRLFLMLNFHAGVVNIFYGFNYSVCLDVCSYGGFFFFFFLLLVARIPRVGLWPYKSISEISSCRGKKNEIFATAGPRIVFGTYLLHQWSSSSGHFLLVTPPVVKWLMRRPGDDCLVYYI